MKKEEILQKLSLVKNTLESVTQSTEIQCSIQILSDITKAIKIARFTNGKDLTGQVFGQLTVLGIHSRIKWSCSCGYIYSWMCRCSCGHIVYKNTYELLHHKGNFPLMCPLCKQNLVHTTHGSTKTKLYEIWCRMKQRCYDKNYPGFKTCGKKGIVVCDEWVNCYQEFEEWAFTHGYKEGLRLLRRNKNDNFSPYNCFFSDKNGNKLITIGNESNTILEWCKIKNMNYDTVIKRKNRGLPQELWFYKGRIPICKSKKLKK